MVKRATAIFFHTEQHEQMLTASHDDDECSVSKLCTFCRFFSSVSVAVSTIDRAAMRIEFQKKNCVNPHRIPILTEPRNPPYPYPTPCVFSLDTFLNKHIYAVHVTMLLCVLSNDNEKKLQ